MVIPLILVVTFLGQSIVCLILPSRFEVYPVALWIPGSVLLYEPVPNWVYPINLASFATSVTTNALVTGLIVFKIVKVYCEVVRTASVESTLRTTARSKLWLIIFIFIESGIFLLCMQLAQLVLNIVQTDAAIRVDQPFAYIVEVLNVIIRSVIFTRFF